MKINECNILKVSSSFKTEGKSEISKLQIELRFMPFFFKFIKLLLQKYNSIQNKNDLQELYVSVVFKKYPIVITHSHGGQRVVK